MMPKTAIFVKHSTEIWYKWTDNIYRKDETVTQNEINKSILCWWGKSFFFFFFLMCKLLQNKVMLLCETWIKHNVIIDCKQCEIMNLMAATRFRQGEQQKTGKVIECTCRNTCLGTISQVNWFIGYRWQHHDWVWKGRPLWNTWSYKGLSSVSNYLLHALQTFL